MTSAINLPTNAHDYVGFVTASPVRGTMELVWGYVFTIVICAWNIQRLSVASPKDSMSKKCFRKCAMALMTIAAPEFPARIENVEYRNARLQTKKMHQKGFKQRITKHAFFANMGAYLLQYQVKKCVIITSREIQWLAEKKMLDPADLEPSEIDNLASENVFQKTITTIQLAWFALKCVGRVVNGLAFSLFEFTKLSFVTCAVVTVLLSWEKPSGVSARIEVRCPSLTRHAIDEMLVSIEGERQNLVLDLRTSDFAEADYNLTENGWLFMATFLFVVGFGAWHVAAWNYSFPTTTETILWRVSSLVTMVLAAVIFVVSDLDLFGRSETYQDFIVVCYVVIRTYIIAETIISLRSAPGGIYQRTRWSDFIPHF